MTFFAGLMTGLFIGAMGIIFITLCAIGCLAEKTGMFDD